MYYNNLIFVDIFQLLILKIRVLVKLESRSRLNIYSINWLSKGERVMKEMNLKPLTEKDRKRNEYLDRINHAPYFTIILTIMVMISVVTIGISLAAF